MSEQETESVDLSTPVDFKDLMPEAVWELSDLARIEWKEAVKSWFRCLEDKDRRKLVRLLQVRERERKRSGE